MLELTKDERAYRRGAVQSLEFLLAAMDMRWDKGQMMLFIGKWHQALLDGRGSTNPAYLGTYMDEIRKRVEEKLSGA